MPRKLLILLLGTAAVAAAALLYSYYIEPQRLVINRHSIKMPRLDPALEGLKIVAIGDIHGGSNGVDAEKLRRIVNVANAEDADLIVLLGDYVSPTSQDRTSGNQGLRMPVEEVANGLSGLSARLGVYAVLGNHDGWFSDEWVRRELTRVGIRVLENEVVEISRDGRGFRLFGLPDHMKVSSWREFSDKLKASLAAAGGDGPVIALEHSPDVLPMITGDLSITPELKLLLAAHTHGGQVWLPVLGSPVLPTTCGQKCAFGESEMNGVKMFVTSGVGESILPFRFLVPPEIAVLTLSSSDKRP